MSEDFGRASPSCRPLRRLKNLKGVDLVDSSAKVEAPEVLDCGRFVDMSRTEDRHRIQQEKKRKRDRSYEGGGFRFNSLPSE